MTGSSENPRLVAHIVGAEKNGSEEDARMVGVGRVEGRNNFLVVMIAFFHAMFSSMMILPQRTVLHLLLYEKLERLRR